MDVGSSNKTFNLSLWPQGVRDWWAPISITLQKSLRGVQLKLTSSFVAVLMMVLLDGFKSFVVFWQAIILSTFDLFIAWYFHFLQVRFFTSFPISLSIPYSEQRTNVEEAEVIDSACDQFLAKPLPDP